jgi:hypothetical protein
MAENSIWCTELQNWSGCAGSMIGMVCVIAEAEFRLRPADDGSIYK